LAGLAMPITFAQALLASWTAIEPTPPAAADTATVSPGWWLLQRYSDLCPACVPIVTSMCGESCRIVV
jgi:hypothetical protein